MSKSHLSTPKGEKKNILSDEMQGYLEHKKEIAEWLQLAEQRIWELEETYLEETPMGNIIRGWETDNKSLPQRRSGDDAKERLFSYSSYQNFVEKLNSEKAIQNRGTTVHLGSHLCLPPGPPCP